MATWGSKLLADFQKLHPQSHRRTKRPQSHWRFPPSGRLKCHIYGAFSAEHQQGGIRVIVRDEEAR